MSVSTTAIQSHGLIACAQAAIAEFAFTDYPALVTADRLHVDSGLWFHIFELLRVSLSSSAHAAIRAHFQSAASFPMLLRAGGDLSQKQSLKSSLKLMSLAKLLPVCLLAHGSLQHFVSLLVGVSLIKSCRTCETASLCYVQQAYAAL